jgi:nitrate reductase molybdenum cofactor assembly chaperone NarJ/NarW
MTATLRALSALLSYPDTALQTAIPEIRTAIATEAILDAQQIESLEPLLRWIEGNDLIDCQEHYVEVFDRGRTHSLHLFEHVHGESRDRGQALVDLRNRYLNAQLDPATNELPDYLPLFLEYCSTLAPENALAELAEPGAILGLLARRLSQRGTAYAAVLAILCELAGVEYDPGSTASAEEAIAATDLGPDALDASWEEQEVRFGAMAPVPMRSH